jgi:SAM-dependent methyltransferase
MSSTHVSILVPLLGRSAELPSTLESIEQYLQTTGFEFEIRVLDSRDGAGYGAMLRRGASDARGEVIVVVDAALPYPVSAIGDAVAMITSGGADLVFAARERHASNLILQSLLVPALPDPALQLKAFSADASRLLLVEPKLAGGGCDLEIAYLANKYGFRIERLSLATRGNASLTFDSVSGLIDAVRIRFTDRNNGYRAPRRCPVCFSTEVWSWEQIPGNVIRACSRCKCRYLNSFSEDDSGSAPVRRVLRPHAPAHDPLDETQHTRTAREKTSLRRLAILRKELPSRARVLEIGVREGSFGLSASREYEYVGIDRAPAVVRAARAKGLEVYCSTVSNFVNTGPAFDAIVLFHVFENMPDPHDALARIKELLKPGGVLLLSTFDTEGLVHLLTNRRWIAQGFRTHLILFSRSALIELLERSGFEIGSVSPDLEYRDHKFVRHTVAARWPSFAGVARALLNVVPDPLLVSSGSIRIIARRRAGPPLNVRAVRAVEPTHAR